MPELIILEVASKIISERKMWDGCSGENMWWGRGRDFPDTYNCACKTVELLVQGK